MARKTDGVYQLVQDALGSISEPYSEDVIEDVCLAIKENEAWHQRYQDLKTALTRDVVNNWIGKYTKQHTGLNSGNTTVATRSGLIQSYTKLRP